MSVPIHICIHVVTHMKESMKVYIPCCPPRGVRWYGQWGKKKRYREVKN